MDLLLFLDPRGLNVLGLGEGHFEGLLIGDAVDFLLYVLVVFELDVLHHGHADAADKVLLVVLENALSKRVDLHLGEVVLHFAGDVQSN